MFKIIEGDFKNNKYSNEEYLDNWPMLYILENGKKAYIGESNHVKTRMTQHTTNEEKRIFNKVHFIYSRLFNQSVTFDYESKLIQYIVADELFQVTNKNSGIADKQYYEKGKYDKKFELLWRKLQKEKLVKHSLEEIENSDLFKYSPYKELNDSQRKAVEDILAQIESGNVNRVVVNGMPGSGKTIVAVYLIEYMDEYTENLQDQMRKAGIDDIRVTYKKCSRDYFDEYWGIDEYDSSDYFYYFILDYYSDSIDSIYTENTSNGDFEPFIKLMNEVRMVKDNREGVYEYSQDIRMGDKWIAVYIGDKNLSGDITIKKESDQTYTLEQNQYARWVYVNGQEVYAKSRETNSAGSSGYSGNSSWGSSSGSSSRNDPYDVYDYDDPDEFADEWGEEFGDGSYEDGYDDAYDYWEEEMD